MVLLEILDRRTGRIKAGADFGQTVFEHLTKTVRPGDSNLLVEAVQLGCERIRHPRRQPGVFILEVNFDQTFIGDVYVIILFYFIYDVFVGFQSVVCAQVIGIDNLLKQRPASQNAYVYICRGGRYRLLETGCQCERFGKIIDHADVRSGILGRQQ